MARAVSVRLFLVIANNLRLKLDQADVSSAFCQGEDLKEEVWMEPLPGFQTYDKQGNKLYWRLIKALYGTNKEVIIGEHD